MLQDFDQFCHTHGEVNELNELSGAVVAIEANFFLRRLLEKQDGLPYEGLVAATGGIPYHLRSFIEDDLEKFKNAGVDVIFFFDGLDAGKRFTPFREESKAIEKCARAWEQYDMGLDSEAAQISFRQTGAMKVDSGCYGLLQSMLKERDIPYRVAPYKAVAQIAYLYQQGTEYIDAVAGPHDLLLYDVDRVIINLNMQQDRFSFVDRTRWMEELATPSHDQFVDACMLTGTSFCRPLPTKGEKRIPGVLEMMRMQGETGLGLCKNLRDDPEMIAQEYIDRFRRARLRVKHSVILTADGKVEPMDAGNVPMDLHEIVGQHLPEELYYYLSIGALGKRLLNDISSEEIFDQVPLDGGNSDEYRSLISERLMPLRQLTLTLLSKWMHRAYQFRLYTYRFWFDDEKKVTFKPNDLGAPDVKVKTWRVQKSLLDSSVQKAPKSSLAFAVQSLTDGSFASKTSTKPASNPVEDAKSPKTPLDSSSIAPNVMWRFLHLRDYTDDKHELTAWGKVLSSIVSSFKMDLTAELEQAALLATELLRLNLLTSNDYWPSYTKQSEQGSWQDKQHRTLLSRVASLGHLSHDNTGYSGRLSRRLLGFNSMITTVQTSLRDLLESCFATLLLNGDAVRDGEGVDLTAIGRNLPLNTPINAALGIAVHHYLEQVDAVPERFAGDEGATAEPERKERWKMHLKTYREATFLLNATDVKGDLEKAWAMWDAVFAGVKTAESLGLVQSKIVEEWTAVDKWLEPRR